MIDLQKVREDTPGCTNKVHFNNAGASLMPGPVVRAIHNHISLEALTGGYEAADAKSQVIKEFYSSCAQLLKCQPRNIAFTSSATSSFARALSCIDFKEGDVILCANEDYISNQIAFLSLQKRFKIKLIRAGSRPEGGVDVNHMELLMKQHRPKLVTLTHVPTNSGLIQPVEQVGELCKQYDLTYLVDACQSAGQLPLDVNKIHCDFLSGTFRKFIRGPRGAGFLFVSDRVLDQRWEPLFLDMRGADWTGVDAYTIQTSARLFEEWEVPYALLLGSKAAIDYALAIGLEDIAKRNKALCEKTRTMLQSLGLKLLDRGENLSSIITVEIPRKSAAETVGFLRDRQINTTASSRSNALIDFDEKGIDWALRISPHYYNTEQEIETLKEALATYIQ